MNRRTLTLGGITLALAMMGAALVGAAGGDPMTDPAAAGPDFAVQGEFRGSADGKPIGVQVIALGQSKFQAVILPGGLPGEGWDKTTRIRFDGATLGGEVKFGQDSGWHGILKGDRFSGKTDKGKSFKAKRVHRRSPREGAKPPKEAIVLFDGKSAPLMENPRITPEGYLMEGVQTKEAIGDCTLHVEFRTPFMPNERGQARGNSGVFFDGRYEVQVLDSFGLNGENNECGGIYSIIKPTENMCYPPLNWQTYDIDFIAPRYRGDLKVSNAIITVWHNGVKIHDQVQIPRTTVGSQEGPTLGPNQLMNHGNPARFKNVWMIKR
jgi:hypothetical protein